MIAVFMGSFLFGGGQLRGGKLRREDAADQMLVSAPRI
jgi:hypothetical protein